MTNNFIIAANERQAQIETAMTAFLESGGRIKIGPSMPERAIPPVRKDWVDPETVLKRKSRIISPAGRKQIRQMTEAL
ncbi:hypothetical protein M2401_000855 [Pseudomonas sp. JUb42]|uniref:hypothetical protein n=1 Tax=Pseudomonas sp. JUb42 TaxID=2940611 RepID=UPI00216A07C1|nr:hypothetical protein [Pseudomonas sp. JUb42]MCS3467134.1 hypothetical protein [Pseudomonas sp. JUb42]